MDDDDDDVYDGCWERFPMAFVTVCINNRFRFLSFFPSPGKKRDAFPLETRFVSSRARVYAHVRKIMFVPEHLEVTKTTFCQKSRVFVRCSLLLFHKRFPIHHDATTGVLFSSSLCFSLSFALPNLSLFLDVKTTRAKTKDTCSAR